jgi:sporulation protein YlmC with PRC-barrel domain
MKQLFSQLIGLPLLLRDTHQKMGRVFNLVMDPDRGTLMGIQTTRAKVIAPVDLGEFRDSYWEVKYPDAPIEESELIRMKSYSREKRKLIHKRVITKSGHDLGRVADFVIDMETLSLVQLYVTKRVWLFSGEKRIIGFKQIQEITEDAVIVTDHLVKSRKTLEEYWRMKKNIGAPIPM